MGTNSAWSGLIFVTGVIVFAVLMAIRCEMSSMWTRALVAGVAFAALGYAGACFRSFGRRHGDS
jgi:hypothetical protein